MVGTLLIYIYFINSKWTPRQSFGFYFPRLFSGLQGKSSKRGLDNIFQERGSETPPTRLVLTRFVLIAC